jgi:hypothetical protein
VPHPERPALDAASESKLLILRTQRLLCGLGLQAKEGFIPLSLTQLLIAANRPVNEMIGVRENGQVC